MNESYTPGKEDFKFKTERFIWEETIKKPGVTNTFDYNFYCLDNYIWDIDILSLLTSGEGYLRIQ